MKHFKRFTLGLILLTITLIGCVPYDVVYDYNKKYWEFKHVKVEGNTFQIKQTLWYHKLKLNFWGKPTIKGYGFDIYVDSREKGGNKHTVKISVPEYKLEGFLTYNRIKHTVLAKDSTYSKFEHKLIFKDSKISQILFYDSCFKIDGPVFLFNKNGKLKHIYQYKNNAFDIVAFTNYPKTQFMDTINIEKTIRLEDSK